MNCRRITVVNLDAPDLLSAHRLPIDAQRQRLLPDDALHQGV
jgi:hypothetical protein